MIDWAQLTLFLYILMRMSGFILLNPLLGRRNIPTIARAGFILVLGTTVFSYAGNVGVAVPGTLIEFCVKLLLEFALGYLLGFVMELFFYIPNLAGQVIDTQMGMSMATTYDAGSQVSGTVTSTLLNLQMMLLFFAAGGHYTLLRLLLTSGNVVPFGAVSIGDNAVNAIITLFLQCTVLAIKLSLPILAAELITQVGMGILIKAIPQVNAFVINIELKVIIGLFLVWVLIAPFSEFLLSAESQMLDALAQILPMAA